MKSIYIARPVGYPIQDLEELRDKLKLAPKREEFHVTLVYSEAFVDWNKEVFVPKRDELIINHAGNEYELEAFGGHVVLMINSSDLPARFQELTAAGVQPSHTDYRPHITLGVLQNDSLPIPPSVRLSSPIYLGPETRDDRPQMKAAIAQAAVSFANDYGPLGRANSGDEAALEAVGNRLVATLAARGLKITGRD